MAQSCEPKNPIALECGLCLKTVKYVSLLFRLATAQTMKLFIKDFLSKCDQIRSLLRIWSHLPKKSLMENFVQCAVFVKYISNILFVQSMPIVILMQ